jgi:ubiquinone/menaquinone biosynthesis C-methylase UbiE
VSDVDPTAAAGFSRAADVYDRARPSYPPEAVEWMAAETMLGPGKTVVDVGAGTGKLTRLLVETGAQVVAVEPIAEMRALIGDEGVEVLDGTAEALPLPDGSADVVTVAQAFHWFDHARALPELHRVLQPAGFLALFWNMRDLDNPLQRRVEDLLAERRGELARRQGGAWRRPLEASRLFARGTVAMFPHEQLFTVGDLCERVASTSFIAAMDEGERDALLAQVRQLAAGLQEPFPFPYRTEVHVIPRSRDRASTKRGTSIKG